QRVHESPSRRSEPVVVATKEMQRPSAGALGRGAWRCQGSSGDAVSARVYAARARSEQSPYAETLLTERRSALQPNGPLRGTVINCESAPTGILPGSVHACSELIAKDTLRPLVSNSGALMRRRGPGADASGAFAESMWTPANGDHACCRPGTHASAIT